MIDNLELWLRNKKFLNQTFWKLWLFSSFMPPVLAYIISWSPERIGVMEVYMISGMAVAASLGACSIAYVNAKYFTMLEEENL